MAKTTTKFEESGFNELEAEHDWPTPGFESTAYLYLSGGLSRARKRFHAGISLHRDFVRCCCPSLRFDYDYFGARSSEMEVNARGAIKSEWIDERLYLKVPEHPTRPEPPHIAYALTPSGIEAAEAFLDAVKQVSSTAPETKALVPKLLAFNWLPQNIAVSHSLAKYPRERSYSKGTEQIPVAIVPESAQSLRPGSLKQFARWLETPGYIELVQQPRASKDGIEFSFSIRSDQIERKYAYLNVAQEDLDRAAGELEHSRAGYMPLHLQRVRSQDDRFVEVTKAVTRRLFKRFPDAEKHWKGEALDLVENFDLTGADRERKRRIDAGKKIASLTQAKSGTPVQCQIRRVGHGAQVTFGEWGATDRAKSVIKEYGMRGLRAYLEDPGDTFSYLAAYLNPPAWEIVRQTATLG